MSDYDKGFGEVVEGDWGEYLESIPGRRSSRCKGSDIGPSSVYHGKSEEQCG